MNISEIFIKRPVMTTLLMAALVIFGLFGYSTLPVSELPDVDFPTIEVSASLPGADPETMASAVATPLESQFSTIAGIASMSSSSTQGKTEITISFNLDRNIDAAAEDVQAAISAASRQLPTEMPAPPTLRKVNPADSPIIYLSMGSPSLPLQDVDQYAETLLARQLSTLNGVAQVNVYGSQKFAVRIQADPDRACSARHRHRSGRQCCQRRQSQHSHRRAERAQAIRSHHKQRPAYRRFAIRKPDHRLQERRAGEGGRCRARSERRGKPLCGKLVQQQARHRARHPAPARLQHHRRCR